MVCIYKVMSFLRNKAGDGVSQPRVLSSVSHSTAENKQIILKVCFVHKGPIHHL